jgi:hypothetical protein
MLDDTESETGHGCNRSTVRPTPVSLPEVVIFDRPVIWFRLKDAAGQQDYLDVWTIFWRNSHRPAALVHIAVHVMSSTRNQPLGHLTYNCISAGVLYDQVSGPCTMWRTWRALTGR